MTSLIMVIGPILAIIGNPLLDPPLRSTLKPRKQLRDKQLTATDFKILSFFILELCTECLTATCATALGLAT